MYKLRRRQKGRRVGRGTSGRKINNFCVVGFVDHHDMLRRDLAMCDIVSMEKNQSPKNF